MKTNHTLRRLAGAMLALALLFVPSIASAQTALSSTTTTAAVGLTDQLVQLTSATGVTAPGTGATFVYLLLDKELMGVRAINGLIASVSRGQNGTRATTHISGITVFVVPPTGVLNYVPSGQCTRTNLISVPVVVGGSDEGSFNGSMYDCLGVTTAGQYVMTSANLTTIFGSTVVSANTIAATGTYFKTSGTTVIKTITVPAGALPGFAITIEATGIDTWDATGNILTAGTFTAAGHTVTFYWNGTKWVPDKVA